MRRCVRRYHRPVALESHLLPRPKSGTFPDPYLSGGHAIQILTFNWSRLGRCCWHETAASRVIPPVPVAGPSRIGYAECFVATSLIFRSVAVLVVSFGTPLVL